MDHNKFATQHGYSLHSYSSDRIKFNYVKSTDDGTLFLTINTSSNTCKIEAYIGLITLSTGEIAFPHPSFASLFETKLLDVLYSYNNYV
jgi:hypothetical protein